MAMIRDGKVYRNIQEQVKKNTEDIEVLKNKPTMEVVIVDELPETGEVGIIYLVPSQDPETSNVYEEYIWLEEENEYELIGSASIDLSNYVTLDGEETITGSKTFTSPIIVGATGYDIKKDGTNIVIEADGNPIKVRGDLLPNTGTTYTLGNASAPWKTVFLSHYVDFGNNAIIQKDSSNRLNLNNGGNAIIKVGGYGNTNRTYIANNLVPDTDGLNLNLGASNMRWSVGYINSIENDYGALQLRARASANPWITLDTNNTGEVGGIAPASDQSAKLGNAGKKFLTTYTRYINDDNVNIEVSKIATKSDPSQPILVGTFNSSGTIDVAASTLPDGVYMFTYAYAQGIAYVNKTQITTATGYGTPIRADIPVVYSGYPTWEARPGNLRISSAADDHYLIQVSDGTHHAYEGAELYAIRINII